MYQFSYTWSHCIDSAYTYGGLGFNNVSSANTNPYNWNADKGTCGFDLRHNISANAVYVLPFKGNRLVEGWQITGIEAWHTGVPFSLGEGDQADLGNNFDNPRPNYVAGCNVYANQNVRPSGTTPSVSLPRPMARSATWEETPSSDRATWRLTWA